MEHLEQPAGVALLITLVGPNAAASTARVPQATSATSRTIG